MRGEHAAAEVEHDDGGGHRVCQSAHDLLKAALLEHEPLHSPLDRDRTLQHPELLVDERREGLFGDRDERHLVRHLEQRKVACARLLDERFRQRRVREAGAEAEAREVVLGEPPDVGALHLRALERDPRCEQHLAAREPRRRVGLL